MQGGHRPLAGICALGLSCLLALRPAAAHEDDLPTRVGRVAELQGALWAWDDDAGEWVAAWRNRPVAQGDRFAVGADGRAELRIGRSELRLGAGSELDVLALDDARIVVELHRGALAWRLASAELARQAEVRTREGSLRPLAAGHYRVDRGEGGDGPTWAGVWQGRLEFVGGGNLLQLDAGERVELRATGGGVRTRVAAMPDDGFGAWARAAAVTFEAESWRHVSPEIPGSEDLDRHGRWDRHPEYGAVWLPGALPPGWAPYAHGRWVWLRPWGWTWVDAMPWGFAPFHYGRWLRWSGRWVWWPGPYGAPPVFQPALVAWIGGPGLSIGITLGPGIAPPPPRAWEPLAPGQVYVPIYRPPPRHAFPPPQYRPPPPRAGPPPRYVQPVPPPFTRRAVAPPGPGPREERRDEASTRAPRPEAGRAEERRHDAWTHDERKSDDRKSDDRKSDDRKFDEPKHDEPKHDGPKFDEPRRDERKSFELKSGDRNPGERRPGEHPFAAPRPAPPPADKLRGRAPDAARGVEPRNPPDGRGSNAAAEARRDAPLPPPPAAAAPALATFAPSGRDGRPDVRMPAAPPTPAGTGADPRRSSNPEPQETVRTTVMQR
ncbi:MAG: hypothetical protein HYZ20_07415 [Burkholderiales bacterium]|nr:hypothetical protein [Burkholderiales bacterium]